MGVVPIASAHNASVALRIPVLVIIGYLSLVRRSGKDLRADCSEVRDVRWANLFRGTARNSSVSDAFGKKTEGVAVVERITLDDAQEGEGGVGEAGLSPVDEA